MVLVSDRVLVTGAAGFVGRHLVERLLADGQSVVATDLPSAPPDPLDAAAVDYRSGDLRVSAFRDELLASEYDRVYHLAAVVGVDDYHRNPLEIVEINVGATRHLLEAVRDRDLRFVYTSTSEVYGKNPAVPWAEDDDRVLGPPTNDRWSYSTGKGLCEHMIHGLADEATFRPTVVRPFNLYGPGQRPDFVVPAFVEAVVDGAVPTVYGDGAQTRCFTYIDDFIEGFVRAARRPEAVGEAINLGSTRETHIEDLAHLVLDVAGLDDEDPEYRDPAEVYGEGYEDLDRRVPDVSKAERLLDWSATMPLRTGVKRLLEWGRENY